MLSTAFREFENDPFFDFGNSPFGRHPLFREHRAPLGASRPALRAAENPDPDDGAAKAASRSRRGGADDRQLERYDERHRRHRERGTAGRDYHDDALALPSMFDDGFGFGAVERHFSQMMDGMHRMMAGMGDHMRRMEEAAQREDFNGHMYSHTSVYSSRPGENGSSEPHVYQAMSETRAGPGGVRETRKAVRDSRSRDERMALGRHIGQRGHVVERRRNAGTGDQQEDHSYTGIGEAEGDAFDKEWHSRATALADDFGGRTRAAVRERRAAPERKAIADARHKL